MLFDNGKFNLPLSFVSGRFLGLNTYFNWLRTIGWNTYCLARYNDILIFINLLKYKQKFYVYCSDMYFSILNPGAHIETASQVQFPDHFTSKSLFRVLHNMQNSFVFLNFLSKEVL